MNCFEDIEAYEMYPEYDYIAEIKESIKDLRTWAKVIVKMFKEAKSIEEWEDKLDAFGPKIEEDGIHFDYTGNFTVFLMLTDYVRGIIRFIIIGPNGKETFKLVKI